MGKREERSDKNMKKIYIVVSLSFLALVITLSYLTYTTIELRYYILLIPPEITASWITAIITTLLIAITLLQLINMQNTSSADFIHRLKKDFFENENTQHLIALIDNHLLKFSVSSSNDIAYFTIWDEKIKYLPDDIKEYFIKKKLYSLYEIDDYLLGHFEDIGLFEKKGVLDIEMVYEEFDWYIELVYENEEIQKYITYLREKEEKLVDVYDNFEYIYKKCKSYGEAKRNNKNLLLWRIKFWLHTKLFKTSYF
ncbi:MAG: hypothetical protein ABDI07_06665 [Candidatus Kryptonium sp.]